MLAIFESILPIFLLIVLGNVLRRTKLMEATGWRGLEDLSYWALYPMLLFVTVTGADFGGLKLDAMLVALLGAVFVMASLVLATWPLFRATGAVTRAEFSSLFQCSVRWNGFVALAVAQKLYPPEASAVVALTMAVIIIPINLLSVSVVSRFGNGRGDLVSVLRAVARNPFIIAIALGLLVRQLPGGLYAPLGQAFELLAQAAIGMGLISIGAALRPADMFSLRAGIWWPVAFKLLLMPVLMGGIGLALGIKGPQLAYLVLCGAVPTAMNGYMLARQLGGDAEYYAGVTTIQTALAALTMPAMLALAAYAASG